MTDEVLSAQQVHASRRHALFQIKEQIDGYEVELARAKARLTVAADDPKEGEPMPPSSPPKSQVRREIAVIEQRLREVRAEETAVQKMVDEAAKKLPKDDGEE